MLAVMAEAVVVDSIMHPIRVQLARVTPVHRDRATMVVWSVPVVPELEAAEQVLRDVQQPPVLAVTVEPVDCFANTLPVMVIRAGGLPAAALDPVEAPMALVEKAVVDLQEIQELRVLLTPGAVVGPTGDMEQDKVVVVVEAALSLYPILTRYKKPLGAQLPIIIPVAELYGYMHLQQQAHIPPKINTNYELSSKPTKRRNCHYKQY
jgi:hypothetical protein